MQQQVFLQDSPNSATIIPRLAITTKKNPLCNLYYNYVLRNLFLKNTPDPGPQAITSTSTLMRQIKKSIQNKSLENMQVDFCPNDFSNGPYNDQFLFENGIPA